MHIKLNGPFNELQAVSLFLALNGASTCTDPFISTKKFCKLLKNAVFIRNRILFFVSAAPFCAFQLEHTPQSLGSVCPTGYQIQPIEYGKMLVM